MKINENVIQEIKLTDYFSAESMRIVPEDAKNQRPGAKEMPFYMEPIEGSKIYKKISKFFMDSVKIYGFIIKTRVLCELFDTEIKGDPTKYYVIFRETADNFLILFAGENEKNVKICSCDKESMCDMIENCRQPDFMLY